MNSCLDLLGFPKSRKKAEKVRKKMWNHCSHLLAWPWLPSLATLEFNSGLDFEKLVFLEKSPFALTKLSQRGLEKKNLG